MGLCLLGVVIYICLVIISFSPIFGINKSTLSFKEVVKELVGHLFVALGIVLIISLWIIGLVAVRYFFHVDYWFPLPPYGDLGPRPIYHRYIEWFLWFWAGR